LAAQAAAPYLHPRLASMEHNSTVTISHEDRVKALAEKLAQLDAERGLNGSTLNS